MDLRKWKGKYKEILAFCRRIEDGPKRQRKGKYEEILTDLPFTGWI
jgi:hypothetical protein